ncbi:MAG: hypothetical protein AAF249_04785 [Pseudomonadota bacterium]
MTMPSQFRDDLIAQSNVLARRVAQSGPAVPVKRRNAVQRVRLSDRAAAGRSGPHPSSFVDYKEVTLRSPHSSPVGQIGSVKTCLNWEGMV